MSLQIQKLLSKIKWKQNTSMTAQKKKKYLSFPLALLNKSSSSLRNTAKVKTIIARHKFPTFTHQPSTMTKKFKTQI